MKLVVGLVRAAIIGTSDSGQHYLNLFSCTFKKFLRRIVIKSLCEKPAFRYLAPFVVFMLLTELQRFADPQSIFFVYALKTILTGALILWVFQGKYREIEGSFADLRAAVLGVTVLVVWILPTLIFKDLPKDISFDPGVFDNVLAQGAAILIRAAGAVLVVPIMEELLWRSFLMRYLIQPDFLKIPFGTYRSIPFWITVAAFTLVHRPWEWPVAALTGILYGAYAVKTKNLKGCILAHAVTNLGLAVYTVITGQWFFW